MTIEKLDPGVWYATCDDCGDQVELDTDPDDDFEDAVQEVKDRNWRINRPELMKYPSDYSGTRRRVVRYWTHTCPDCR